MKFKTHYNFKEFPKTYELQCGNVLVERAGYVPSKQRIEEFMLAGRRLKEFRMSQYDFPDPNAIDPTVFDPTRKKGYDMADATQDSMRLTGRLKTSQQRKAEDEALKKAEADALKQGQNIEKV